MGALGKNVLISRNPATLDVLGEVPIAGAQEVRAAVDRAREASSSWAGLGYAERGRYLRRLKEIILEDADAIAQLVCREGGKPIVECYSAELFPACDFLEYFSRHAEKLLREKRLRMRMMDFLGRRAVLTYRPLGVVGIISPWNYPFYLAVGQSAMALVVGNTVVLKPSELTPLVGERIGELFRKADFPAGVIEVVLGDGRTGAALVDSGLSKIVFTGSETTARKILEGAARQLTPVVLELGGKDPMIVCEDADLAVTSSGAVWGAFVNSGQTCASVKRLYVAETVANRFLDMLVGKTRRLKQGIPTDPTVELGSMISGPQLEKVAEQVERALRQGAKLLHGGRRAPGLPGHFFQPTIFEISDHTPDIAREETFGPVLVVKRVKDEEEAIRLANDSPFGLTASVWTTDLERGRTIADRLEAGTVYINECAYTGGVCETPWGGMKRSGFGRTNSFLGLLELVQPVHVNTNLRPHRRSPWWYPYGEKLYQLFRAVLPATFRPGIGAKIRSLPALLRSFSFDLFRTDREDLGSPTTDPK